MFLTECTHALVCLQVKRAILTSLGIIIDKGGQLLRPFLPQLQPTFVKSLNDANKVCLPVSSAMSLSECTRSLTCTAIVCMCCRAWTLSLACEGFLT